MKMTLLAGLALALGPMAAGAGEHPKEHPTAQGQEHPKGQEHKKGHDHAKDHEQPKGQEHPAGHEHPVGSKAWTKQMSKEFTKAVEEHVAQKSAAEGGAFMIHDDKLGKDWSLKLVGVHKKRVAHLGDNRFFACADFKPVGKGSKGKIDLDFYAVKNADAWEIEQVLVHKVNGAPRYTYNDKNEMVPVE